MDRDIYRFQVGAIACIVFADARKPLTQALVESIFTQDAERIVAQWHALLQPEEFCRNILYLETGGRRVLIDTGEGDNDDAQPGRLLDLLRAEGIEPASIDTIILTHFHVDHFGGLLNAQGKPNYPNARLVTTRAEHDYWMRDDILATLKSPRADILRQIFAAYPVQFAQAGDEVEPGVRLVAAPGHTPGHIAVEVESQDTHLLHIVDAAHMVMQLRAPDAIPRFDVEPEIAVATRLALFDATAVRHMLVIAYHFTFPGLGYIQRTGMGQRMWTPYRNREDVPDYLLESYDMLDCAYPDRIPDSDYWPVIALIYPYMGSRTLPKIVSALTTKSYSRIYADSLRLERDVIPSEEDIARVKQKLDACGFQELIKKANSDSPLDPHVT